MTKIHSDKAGFGAVEGILIVIIVVLIGALGYVGYKAFNKTAANDSPVTTQPVTKTPQPVDPYADWKTYCSTTGAVCFKYPSDWKTATSGTPDPNISGVTITSPSNLIVVRYDPLVEGIGGVCEENTCFFDTKAIDKPSSSSYGNLKIVKGVYANKNSTLNLNVDYYISSDDQIASSKLVIGKNVDVGFFVTSFTNPGKGSQGREFLRVQNVQNNGFDSVASADKWFSDVDVITAGKILSSVTLN